ncbi:MAG: ADOP family duplicated permease, partial [Vicinamibacterales bacterium]
MDSLFQDVRVALRQLAARPGFTAIVLITLALGIGATTTCFSLLSAFALRPLPFANPDQLVAIEAVERSADGPSSPTFDTFNQLHDSPELFSGSVAFALRAVTVSGSTAAERVAAAEVSGDLFALLGVPLQRGRSLTRVDPDGRTAVIGHNLWTRRFGSDPAIVGAALMLDGEPFTVSGVAAPKFSFPRGAEIWFNPAAWTSDRRVDVVGRLNPGVPVQQADAALGALAVSAAPREHWTITAVPLRDRMITDKHRNGAFALLVASGLVLAVACANLAGLLLAQVGARRHEIAVRSAIGASRPRLVRQLMTESLVLSLAGGVLGALAAQWGVDLFVSKIGLPREAEWLDFAVDGRVLAFALTASICATLLFGVVPACRGSRVDIRGVLQEDDRTSSSGPRARRVRAALVALQVALSLCLVAGAASVVMSSMSLDRIDPGFNQDRLLAVRASLAGSAFEAPERRMAFVDAASERLRALPGVAAVTAVSHVPVGDRDISFSAFLVAGAAADTSRLPAATVRFADSGYIETMGIPLRLGRGFTRAEARDAHGRVVLINDTMARRHWPAGDAVGGRIRLSGTPQPAEWFTVVGVVGGVAQRQLPAAPENQVYLPIAQARDVTLVVRAVSDVAAVAASAREAVRGADNGVAISTRTMTDMYLWYTNDRRSQGLVLAVLGGVALLVAALGVYGVMALMVTERHREIAIRKALGASNAGMRRLVLGRGLKLTSIGLGAGLMLAIPLTAFLSSIFYGVHAFDLRVLGTTAALLGGVAIAASWWPARRAM